MHETEQAICATACLYGTDVTQALKRASVDMLPYCDASGSAAYHSHQLLFTVSTGELAPSQCIRLRSGGEDEIPLSPDLFKLADLSLPTARWWWY